MPISTRADYDHEFSARKAKALELALDTRKFEISLYWQRTAYFWALIAAAFAGYFVVLSAEHAEHREFNSFAIACIGLVFSLAWYRVNRGSKFWQENWERHVDLLEDETCGPLYKTVLRNPRSELSLLAGAPVSVSRVNQWVAVYAIAIWGSLAVIGFPSFAGRLLPEPRYLAIAACTIVAALLLLFGTRSKLGKSTASGVINRTPDMQ